MKKSILIVAAIGLLFLYSRCPTAKEVETVKTLTEDMRTIGVGRHLIDIPKQWEWSTDSEVTLHMGTFNGPDFFEANAYVFATDISKMEFDNIIRERAARITAEKLDNGKPMLLSQVSERLHTDDKTPRAATSLRFDEGGSGISQEVELHLWLGGAYVMFKGHAFENVYAPVEERLRKLASQTFLVRDPERAGAGFILGPVIIRADNNNEFGELVLRDRSRGDLEFVIEFNAQTHDPEETMFNRADQFLPMFDVGSSALRRGRRAIADMDGREMLLSVHWKDEDSGKRVRGILFAAESAREARLVGLAKPRLEIRMEAMGKIIWKTDEESREYFPFPGFYTMPSLAQYTEDSRRGYRDDPHPEQGDASLTDYEAKQVWDAMLSSIRLRPGAVPPPPKPQPLPQPHTDEEMASNQRAMDNFIAGGEFVDPLKGPHTYRSVHHD